MRRLVAAALAALSLTGCAALAGPEANRAADGNVAALPAEVRSALGMGRVERHVEGAVAEVVVLSAPLSLPPVPVEGDLLAGDVVAGCLALARSLASTDVRAYAQLPSGTGFVEASEASCPRGASLDPWAPAPEVSASPGPEMFELGLPSPSGARLYGVRVDVREGVLGTSSVDSPRQVPVAPFDPATFDAALAASRSALPLVLPDGSGELSTPYPHVFVTSPGTVLSALLECAAPDPDHSLGFRADRDVAGNVASFFGSAGPSTVPASPGEYGCEDGPREVVLVPSLRYVDASGTLVEVTVLDVFDIRTPSSDSVTVTALP